MPPRLFQSNVRSLSPSHQPAPDNHHSSRRYSLYYRLFISIPYKAVAVLCWHEDQIIMAPINPIQGNASVSSSRCDRETNYFHRRASKQPHPHGAHAIPQASSTSVMKMIWTGSRPTSLNSIPRTTSRAFHLSGPTNQVWKRRMSVTLNPGLMPVTPRASPRRLRKVCTAPFIEKNMIGD